MADPLTNARFAQQLFDPALQAFGRSNAGRVAIAEREANQRARAAQMLMEQNFGREIEASRANRDMERLRYSERQADRRTDAQVERDEQREIRELKKAIQQAYSRGKLSGEIDQYGDINSSSIEELNAMLSRVSAAASEREVDRTARTINRLNDDANKSLMELQQERRKRIEEASREAITRAVASSGNGKFIGEFNDKDMQALSPTRRLAELQAKYSDAVEAVMLDMQDTVRAVAAEFDSDEQNRLRFRQVQDLRAQATRLAVGNPDADVRASQLLADPPAMNGRGQPPPSGGVPFRLPDEDEPASDRMGRLLDERFGPAVVPEVPQGDAGPAKPNILADPQGTPQAASAMNPAYSILGIGQRFTRAGEMFGTGLDRALGATLPYIPGTLAEMPEQGLRSAQGFARGLWSGDFTRPESSFARRAGESLADMGMASAEINREAMARRQAEKEAERRRYLESVEQSLQRRRLLFP
jgi:hypothetical protein